MIIIIDRSFKTARLYADIFHYMGILAYAATPHQALNEINNRYRAILLCDAEKSGCDDEYLRSIRRASLGAPVFALCDDRNEHIAEHGHSSLIDEYFDSKIFSSTLYDKIEKYQVNNGLPVLGQYRLAGLDASVRLSSVNLYGEQIPFSKTETMILRYLMRTYPLDSPTKDILKHAFKPGKSPEPSSVRTHISAINKKYSAFCGKPLIAHEHGKGYGILTPEKLFATAND